MPTSNTSRAGPCFSYHAARICGDALVCVPDLSSGGGLRERFPHRGHDFASVAGDSEPAIPQGGRHCRVL